VATAVAPRRGFNRLPRWSRHAPPPRKTSNHILRIDTTLATRYKHSTIAIAITRPIAPEEVIVSASVTCAPALLTQTAAKLRAGQLDPVAYVAELCDRLDATEPQVRALLPEPGRRARLIAEATALRDIHPDPATRPPLYGVVVGVKDIFRADGFATGCGSALPPELFAGPEAVAVTAIRAAGALVLGKTVTTEFASSEPGPTRNPRALAHTPGGSSSGSAAAVAAGFCPLAFGSQTVGSIIRPAAFCGVVGFKPSYGRIATAGVIPYSVSADHVGLFTQDVAGMRLAAAILCADWWEGAIRAARPVLGVPDGPYLAQASRAGLAAFERHLDLLRAGGYTIRRVPAFADIEEINTRHRRMALAEMARVHADWFPRYEARYRPGTVANVRDGRAVGGAELDAAREGRDRLRAALETAMRDAGIDLWVCPPATGTAPVGLDATGDPIMNLPWTHAGLPVVTVPAGRDDAGLPFGLQCVAPFGADERLLAWAESLAEVVGA